MPKKLAFQDQRMLDVMKFVIDNEINGVDTQTKFLHSIGYMNANNISLVRKGSQSFTREHFSKACEVYKVDGNFFLDKKHTVMFKENRNVSAMAQLKEAVARVGVELNERVALVTPMKKLKAAK